MVFDDDATIIWHGTTLTDDFDSCQRVKQLTNCIYLRHSNYFLWILSLDLQIFKDKYNMAGAACISWLD